MTKLPITSGTKIIKALRHFGWRAVRQKGRHVILTKKGMRAVPVPDSKEVNRPLLRKIIKETKVDIKEFLKYLFVFLFKR